MLSRAALSRRAFAKTDIPAVQKRSFAQEGEAIAASADQFHLHAQPLHTRQQHARSSGCVSGSTIKEVPQDQAKGSASAHQPEQHIKGNSVRPAYPVQF